MGYELIYQYLGVIMAALGMETTFGDFEVIDLCFAGLPNLVKPEAGPSRTVNGDPKGKGRAKESVDMNGSVFPAVRLLAHSDCRRS